MIYEPREDSWLLKKYVEKLAFGKVLDLGTGSGIQVLAASRNTKDVLATDINPEAVAAVTARNIKAIVADLFANINDTFDTIIFNPPYLPEEPHEDLESKVVTTGGKEGNEILVRFLQGAKNHLRPKGRILLVVSSLTKDAFNLFKKFGYSCQILEEQHITFETISVCCLAHRKL